jgi:hypothetical protein
MSRPKVMVNVLNQGTTSAGLETQLFAWMQELSREYEFKIFFPAHRPIPNTRHHIVKDFLAGDYDYLVMIDDDNPPHKNIFELLRLDLPVVGGVYPGKTTTGIGFHVYREVKKNKKTYFKQYPVKYRKGLQKVDAVATGLICIKREVIESLKDDLPFEETFKNDGTLAYGDDMGFCIKCKEKGIDVYAHWDYYGSHWKMVDLMWVADLVAYAAQTGKTNYDSKYN